MSRLALEIQYLFLVLMVGITRKCFGKVVGSTLQGQ